VSVGALAVRRPSARFRRALGPVGLRWATLLVLIALWQVLISGFLPGNKFVAPPSDVVRAFPDVLRDDRVIDGLVLTGKEFGLAFAIAGGLGILFGASIGMTRRLFGPTRNLLQVLFTLPQVALYPLFVLWLGVGIDSKVAFGVTHGFFPVALTTMMAARTVDPNLVTAVRAMGGGRWRVLTKAVLPWIVPDIVAGLRIGASLTLLGVLLAELMVQVGGIGAVIQGLSSSFRPAPLDAVIVIVCVFAATLNALIRRVELRLSRWRSA
jgi:NitT/TauT family transport system permease protein